MVKKSKAKSKAKGKRKKPVNTIPPPQTVEPSPPQTVEEWIKRRIATLSTEMENVAWEVLEEWFVILGGLPEHLELVRNADSLPVEECDTVSKYVSRRIDRMISLRFNEKNADKKSKWNEVVDELREFKPVLVQLFEAEIKRMKAEADERQEALDAWNEGWAEMSDEEIGSPMPQSEAEEANDSERKKSDDSELENSDDSEPDPEHHSEEEEEEEAWNADSVRHCFLINFFKKLKKFNTETNLNVYFLSLLFRFISHFSTHDHHRHQHTLSLSTTIPFSTHNYHRRPPLPQLPQPLMTTAATNTPSSLHHHPPLYPQPCICAGVLNIVS